MIQYALRWRIFPIRWTTEIVEWNPPHGFVDVQLKGPYKLWRHEHRFVAIGDSTQILDEVQYRLPFGLLGAFAHAVKVKSDVKGIFEYRKAAVDKKFSNL